MKDGLIYEHWDAVQEEVANVENENTMTDGGGDSEFFVSQQILERNKSNVRRFFDEGFSQAKPSVLSELIGDTYTQHNPFVADGKQAIFVVVK